MHGIIYSTCICMHVIRCRLCILQCSTQSVHWQHWTCLAVTVWHMQLLLKATSLPWCAQIACHAYCNASISPCTDLSHLFKSGGSSDQLAHGLQWPMANDRCTYVPPYCYTLWPLPTFVTLPSLAIREKSDSSFPFWATLLSGTCVLPSSLCMEGLISSCH